MFFYVTIPQTTGLATISPLWPLTSLNASPASVTIHHAKEITLKINNNAIKLDVDALGEIV